MSELIKKQVTDAKAHMDKALYEQIVAKCKAMGYPVDQLVSQKFKGEIN